MAILLLALALNGSARAPRADRIRGQVFIVTNGGENVKLGLVPVGLYSERVIATHLAARGADAATSRGVLEVQITADQESLKTATALYQDALKKVAIREAGQVSLNDRYDEVERLKRAIWSNEARLRSIEAPAFYFAGLPKPAVSAVTDAEGEFVIGVPKGRWIIAAEANRQVFGNVEAYYWLLRVPSDARNGAKLLLSNSNLTTGEAILALVPAKE